MGAANECIPFYEPGARITGHATADVVGKRFVDISATIQAGPGLNTSVTGGNISVAHATAAGKVIGVSSHDASSGKKVTILMAGVGLVLPVKSAGNIAAGAEVEVGSSGQVVTIASGRAVGRCLATCTSGDDAMIKLY